jgi:hypothetical protein
LLRKWREIYLTVSLLLSWKCTYLSSAAGEVDVHPSHARFKRQLIEAAQRVRANNWNWVPLFVMIDKSAAEMKALSKGIDFP